MRFYRIEIGGTVYTSLVNGQTDPGALNVEFDIPVSTMSAPLGSAFIRVWGVALQTLAQSNNLNNQQIKVFGGMAKGLPLANPAQQGLLVQGTIFPAFGNWEGTDMTLDMYVVAPFGAPSIPAAKNIVHNWQQGQPLANAIKSTLGVAFPGFKLNINISPNLVQSFTDTGFYQTLEQYGTYIRQISKSILGASEYPGVLISSNGETINVSDGTQASSGPKQIQFQDMVGQPTWIAPNIINVKTVMRGDLKILDQVKLPPSLATTTAASAPQFRSNSAFQGTFQVNTLRHLGNFRQPDARSWVTTMDLAVLNSAVG